MAVLAALFPLHTGIVVRCYESFPHENFDHPTEPRTMLPFKCGRDWSVPLSTQIDCLNSMHIFPRIRWVHIDFMIRNEKVKLDSSAPASS